MVSHQWAQFNIGSGTKGEPQFGDQEKLSFATGPLLLCKRGYGADSEKYNDEISFHPLKQFFRLAIICKKCTELITKGYIFA